MDTKGKRSCQIGAVQTRRPSGKASAPQELETAPVTTGKPTKMQLQPAQRRGYVLNEETGRLERIIRKRKRKSGDQLQHLNSQFDANPHWSKETLLALSKQTGLSEGQVYKWGWD